MSIANATHTVSGTETYSTSMTITEDWVVPNGAVLELQCSGANMSFITNGYSLTIQPGGTIRVTGTNPYIATIYVTNSSSFTMVGTASLPLAEMYLNNLYSKVEVVSGILNVENNAHIYGTGGKIKLYGNDQMHITGGKVFGTVLSKVYVEMEEYYPIYGVGEFCHVAMLVDNVNGWKIPSGSSISVTGSSTISAWSNRNDKVDIYGYLNLSSYGENLRFNYIDRVNVMDGGKLLSSSGTTLKNVPYIYGEVGSEIEIRTSVAEFDDLAGVYTQGAFAASNSNLKPYDPTGSNTSWKGITIAGDDANINMSYCTVRDIDSYPERDAAITLLSATDQTNNISYTTITTSTYTYDFHGIHMIDSVGIDDPHPSYLTLCEVALDKWNRAVYNEHSHVTINGCEIQDNYYGVYLEYGYLDLMTYTCIHDNYYYGLYIDHANIDNIGCYMIYCNIINNQYGQIYLNDYATLYGYYSNIYDMAGSSMVNAYNFSYTVLWYVWWSTDPPMIAGFVHDMSSTIDYAFWVDVEHDIQCQCVGPEEKISASVNMHDINISAYPNPFNPTTTLTYDLPADMYVTISVYSLTGAKVDEVMSGMMEKGSHSIQYSPKAGMSSGKYMVVMTTDAGNVKQMISLVK